MSKFNELRKSLKANTIVIIENEFTLINDSLKLLAFYSLSNENISGRINEGLSDKNFDEIKDLLKKFKADFIQLNHNDDLIKKMPALDYLDHYLEKIDGKQILDNFNIARFDEIIEADELQFVKNTFLKFGAINTYPSNQYDDIITQIKQIENSEILFYNQAPTVEGHEDFIKDVKESILLTNSNFYLCLIDKSLGNGEDSAGKDFAFNHLIKLNQAHDLNSVCFIYTSRLTGNNNLPSKLEEYYVQEIEKSSPPHLDQITKVLAQSAYATVFDNICKNFNFSINSSLNTVLKNQKNIKYIVDKSHEEGISPYDSIKYWYNLLLQKYFEENEIKNYSYVATLSSFFKNDFLEDHQNMSDIYEDIKNLNNYELFDDNVNSKLLPIAPGDIWHSNGNYYILMGQLCDMLIRKGDENSNINTRNGKIGELLKINFEKTDLKKDKYHIEVVNNKKHVYIQNFKDMSGEYLKLKIDISTPNIDFVELRVLDLCMFNRDGECKMNINEDLESEIKSMLIENKDIYYYNLQKKYKNIAFNNLSQIIEVLNEDSPIKFGITSFSFDNDIIDYKIKRVSRLKGRYYDSLYNNFINNKGRIDLNLIDNYAIKSEKIKLKCQIENHDDTIEEIEIDLYSNKDQKYFLKKDLIKKLSVNFHELLNLLNEQINPFDKNHCSFIEDENFELSFLIKFEEKSIIKEKINFDYRFLFKSNQNKYKDLSYFIAGLPENLISFEGNSISLENLKIGIEIPQTNQQMILSNGIIKINTKQ
ncbi:hypothetical protein ACHRVW_11445 [Flavobacterium collinsii]|uniref:hypothetical protein n=1 Tax=Flavobacterium collinsii TaxID=1114861 RepID=UPI0037566D1E